MLMSPGLLNVYEMLLLWHCDVCVYLGIPIARSIVSCSEKLCLIDCATKPGLEGLLGLCLLKKAVAISATVHKCLV